MVTFSSLVERNKPQFYTLVQYTQQTHLLHLYFAHLYCNIRLCVKYASSVAPLVSCSLLCSMLTCWLTLIQLECKLANANSKFNPRHRGRKHCGVTCRMIEMQERLVLGIGPGTWYMMSDGDFKHILRVIALEFKNLQSLTSVNVLKEWLPSTKYRKSKKIYTLISYSLLMTSFSCTVTCKRTR